MWCKLHTQLLALVTFESISLVKENLRRLRENLKHKILPQVAVGRDPFQLNPRTAPVANVGRANVSFFWAFPKPSGHMKVRPNEGCPDFLFYELET